MSNQSTIFNVMLARVYGGTDHMFCNYSKALESEGYNVVNIIRRNAKVAKRVDHVGIGVINQYDFIAAFKIHRMYKKLKPKVIIAHGLRALKLIKMFKKNCTVVLVAHNYAIKYYPEVNYIICLTRDLKRYAENLGYKKSQICLVPNFIDAAAERILTPPRPKNTIRLGAMGRMVHQKGFDVLLRACALLQNHQRNYKVIIAGDGEERAKLERLAGELKLHNVEFVGWLDNVDEFYNHIDVFCLTSRTESFGLVLLEAMSRKKLVIAPNIQGPAEIIKNHKNGILFESQDYRALEKKLRLVLQNPKMIEDIAERGHVGFLSEYTIEKVAPKLSRLLKQIGA